MPCWDVAAPQPSESEKAFDHSMARRRKRPLAVDANPPWRWVLLFCRVFFVDGQRVGCLVAQADAMRQGWVINSAWRVGKVDFYNDGMFASKDRTGENVQIRAAALLVTTGALVELSAADAREIVGYMRPQRVKAGTVVIREGEATRSDFMALLLDGEVTVENTVAAAHDSMVVSVLGPGALIGDMGIIDGGPRSATCTAATDLALAVLTREAMTRLMQERPAVAARLLMAMSKRIADHLRETNRKLMTFAQVSKALQEELDAVHGVNKRLLEQLAALNRAQSGGTPG